MRITNVKKFIRSILIIMGIIFCLTLFINKSSLSHGEIEYKTIYVSEGDTLWNIAKSNQKNNGYTTRIYLCTMVWRRIMWIKTLLKVQIHKTTSYKKFSSLLVASSAINSTSSVFSWQAVIVSMIDCIMAAGFLWKEPKLQTMRLFSQKL